jgi:membrane protein involved in colicin uptake
MQRVISDALVENQVGLHDEANRKAEEASQKSEEAKAAAVDAAAERKRQERDAELARIIHQSRRA